MTGTFLNTASLEIRTYGERLHILENTCSFRLKTEDIRMLLLDR